MQNNSFIKRSLSAAFLRRILIVLVLPFVACSVPGSEPETELIAGVRRYVVSVKMGDHSMAENMYLVFDLQTKNAVIIDPGARDRKMEEFIAANRLKVLRILNTHGHFDHTSANHSYSGLYQAPLATHRADAEFFREENAVNKPDKYFAAEDRLDAGFGIQIIATPGHSAGSVCYLIHDRLFTGDTLFRGSIGRVWGATEKEENEKTAALIQNIRTKLLVLPETTFVFPGHGDLTDIGFEKRYNPYLQ